MPGRIGDPQRPHQHLRPIARVQVDAFTPRPLPTLPHLVQRRRQQLWLDLDVASPPSRRDGTPPRLRHRPRGDPRDRVPEVEGDGFEGAAQPENSISQERRRSNGSGFVNPSRPAPQSILSRLPSARICTRSLRPRAFTTSAPGPGSIRSPAAPPKIRSRPCSPSSIAPEGPATIVSSPAPPVANIEGPGFPRVSSRSAPPPPSKATKKYGDFSTTATSRSSSSSAFRLTPDFPSSFSHWK